MIGKLHTIAFDTPDAPGLAGFYGDLLGLGERKDSADGKWITLALPSGQRLAFQQADDHVPPRWPDPEHPQQLHLDLRSPDREGTVDRALQLGASRLVGGGDTWTVLADPSGHPFCVADGSPDTPLELADVSIDCPDGSALAAFYSELLGMPVTYSGAEGAMISAEGQLPVMFQNIERYNAPRWPDPAHPQQLHLDVAVTDIEEAERLVLKLGASRLPGGGDDFRVYADPIGHPFCLEW